MAVGQGPRDKPTERFCSSEFLSFALRSSMFCHDNNTAHGFLNALNASGGCQPGGNQATQDQLRKPCAVLLS